MTMLLQERRIFPIRDRIRNVLMGSELDIGVSIADTAFDDVKREFSEQEVNYAIRYLIGKGYFEPISKNNPVYTLTSKAFDEWLFPDGPIEENSIFISYAKEDAPFAGELKAFLEGQGLKAFLAHEDIEPAARWRDRIISDLKTCHIFIALRTKNYLKKQYTEQECGFALALGKRILPLCIGTEISEMGFCSEFQGKKFDESERGYTRIFDYCKKQLVPMIRRK